MHYSSSFQLLDVTKILLDSGADQNLYEYEYQLYPIFYAVIQNNIQLTKIFTDNGTNPNNQDYLGNTILHYAIMYNNLEIIDHLFSTYEIKKNNSDINNENVNNNSIVNIIDPEITNIDGLSISHLILYKYNSSFDKYIKTLLENIDINYQDNVGNTVLHILAEKNLIIKFSDISSQKN